MSNDARREQLLDICASMVDQDGFAAFSFDRIAGEADVSRTVPYQQFGGLDGMFETLVERSRLRALRALDEATTDNGLTLRDGMSAVLKAADADPSTWRMFLVGPRVGPASLNTNLEPGRAMIRSRNAAAIDPAAEPGLCDTELTARMLQAMADEVVRLRLSEPDTYTGDRVLDQVEWTERRLFAPHPQRTTHPKIPAWMPTGSTPRANPLGCLSFAFCNQPNRPSCHRSNAARSTSTPLTARNRLSHRVKNEWHDRVASVPSNRCRHRRTSGCRSRQRRTTRPLPPRTRPGDRGRSCPRG